MHVRILNPWLPVVAAIAFGWAVQAQTELFPETLEALGETLFFDTDLSANRSQSCATCHLPPATSLKQALSIRAIRAI